MAPLETANHEFNISTFPMTPFETANHEFNILTSPILVVLATNILHFVRQKAGVVH